VSGLRKIAFFCYAVIAVVSAVLGSTYLVRDEFMPYHAEALKTDWGALDAPLQTLLLALMRVAGAGWLALALAIAALLAFAFSSRRIWARVTLPVLILIFYIPVLSVTLWVSSETGADVPWYGNAMAVAATLVAIVCEFLDGPEESVESQ